MYSPDPETPYIVSTGSLKKNPKGSIMKLQIEPARPLVFLWDTWDTFHFSRFFLAYGTRACGPGVQGPAPPRHHRQHRHQPQHRVDVLCMPHSIGKPHFRTCCSVKSLFDVGNAVHLTESFGQNGFFPSKNREQTHFQRQNLEFSSKFCHQWQIYVVYGYGWLCYQWHEDIAL